MTQDVYMSRGKVHTQVAEALNDAISGALTGHRDGADPENRL
jgi:peptidyl-tRNA hydrolase